VFGVGWVGGWLSQKAKANLNAWDERLAWKSGITFPTIIQKGLYIFEKLLDSLMSMFVAFCSLM